MPVVVEGGRDLYQRRVRAQFSNPEVHTLVAELDGQLIGFALGALVDLRSEMFVREKSGHVADIFVEEAYRRQGVGRKLVDGLVDWFRLSGAHQTEWSVATQNTTARAFWKTIGGREVMVRMRLDL
jgi:ribosomal-protein-alanine N-acetyltransferase